MQMRPLPILLAGLLLIGSPALLAQVDTAHHRKVYAEINRKADAMDQVELEFTEENTEVTVTGWSQQDELRKISVLLLGDHGRAVEEYYLEDGKPLFIHTVTTTEELDGGKVVARVENRYYFEGDRMIQWLNAKKESVAPDSDEYKQEASALLDSFHNFEKLLREDPADEAVAQQVEGVFKGIEQGDYFHWNMTNEKGEEVSFFILNAGDKVDEVLNDADAYIGRRCRVSYVTGMVEIPEAGGKMEISQITGVEWLKLQEPAHDK